MQWSSTSVTEQHDLLLNSGKAHTFIINTDPFLPLWSLIIAIFVSGYGLLKG